MTVRIQREFSFNAGVWQNSLTMNSYAFMLSMEVNTSSPVEQAVAIQRTKLFIDDFMNDVVFIKNTEKKIVEKLTSIGIRTCMLPEEPYDQIIGMMLMLKLDAIMEGRISVTDIYLSSSGSDGIGFIQEISDCHGPFVGQSWWNRPDPSYKDDARVKGKIVNLFDPELKSWNDLDLSWEEFGKPTIQIT